MVKRSLLDPRPARLIRRASSVVASAVAGSAAAMMFSWPWLPGWHAGLVGLLLALFITVPLALTLELVTALARVPAGRIGLRGGLPGFGPRRQLQAWLGVTIFGVGAYLSNKLLNALPTERDTVMGCLLAAALGALASWALGSWLRGESRVGRWLAEPGVARTVTTGILMSGAMLLQGAGNVFLPAGYPHGDQFFHVVALVCWVAAARLLMRSLRSAQLQLLAAVCVAGVLTVAKLSLSQPHPAAVAAPARRTLSFYAVQGARWLADGDGDGKSARFGGTDCHDADPLVRPLSLAGRDCLGWLPSPVNPPPPLPALRPPAAPQGPRILVYVTIESFRCGLGQREALPLRDGCPHLAALAREGRVRLDVRTPTHTALALNAMFMRNEVNTLSSVPGMLRQAGFRTHAIVPVPFAGPGTAIGALFDEVDGSLIKLSRGASSTVAAGTDRALQWLERAVQSGGRHFLWLHHYDTHEPYVKRPGARFVGNRLADYLAELRRTDDQLLRLRQALGRSPAAEETLLLVTADHGEDMGELGHEHHGRSLRETSTRIPFVAWSAGADARRFVPHQLPGTPKELGPFLLEVLGGTRFVSDPDVTFCTTARGHDPQIGIYSGGWKLVRHLKRDYTELFDLAADPQERQDLSQQRPDRVQDLGRLLGRRVLQDQVLYDLVARY